MVLRRGIGYCWQPHRSQRLITVRVFLLLRLAQRPKSFPIRPPNQLLQILFRQALRVNNTYPMETCEIPGVFDAGHVGKFKEALGRHADAETPLFGFAGFEVGESFVADEVDKDIGGMAVFAGANTG